MFSQSSWCFCCPCLGLLRSFYFAQKHAPWSVRLDDVSPKLAGTVEPPFRTTRHVGIQKMHDLKYGHAYILSHNLMKFLGRNTFSIGSIHLRLFLHFPAINQLLGILTLYAMEFGEICLPYVQITPLAWCLMLNSYTHEKTQSHEPTTNYQATENRTQNRQLTSVLFHHKYLWRTSTNPLSRNIPKKYPALFRAYFHSPLWNMPFSVRDFHGGW